MKNDIYKTNDNYLRKPEWLRIRLPNAYEYNFLKSKLTDSHLHTICESGNCPNQAECWQARTGTIMILGDVCSRNCKFCNVKSGKCLPLDEQEAANVAILINELNLKHAVLTSVTRDDLPDGGAKHWADVITEIRKQCKSVTIETLIPDFKLNFASLNIIAEAAPEVVSHNLETVERITPLVRSNANYRRSLDVLEYLYNKNLKVKTGIMVGLGETDDEVYKTMDDVLKVGCKIITIGQYLQPSLKHYPVYRYVHPDTFEIYRELALHKGFKHVESAPLVRSSYHASKHVK